jgi:flagellar hook-associated protein 2
MATVGINFGSATSGAGFDVVTTVASIVAIQQGIETPWKTQLTALKAQDTALSTIGTDLATLSTSVAALTNFDGVMVQKQGSSSDTNVLALTAASTTAIAGSHTVTVNQLAQTSSFYTANEAASAADTLTGSLTIAVGTAASQTIPITNSNNTLNTLAAAINTGSYGVTASVLTDTTGSRLSLVSNTSGSAGLITVASTLSDTTPTAPVALNFTLGQLGQDAKVNVDGISVSSASNTVTNAIPGVTFQLLSVATGTPVQVQIANDNSAIETAVQTFVSSYNTVATDLKTQEGKDTTGNSEPLYGNPTLSTLQTQLTSALFGGAASGAIANITQLGLSVDETGVLSLDVSTLDAVLNSNFSDVSGFLQNAASFGQTFTTTLNNIGTSSTNSLISLAQVQNTSVETQLNTNVTNEDALIANNKTNLTTELNTANQVLQSIPSQLNEISEIYSAITGYNKNSTG